MRIAIIQSDTRTNDDIINNMISINRQYANVNNYTYIFETLNQNQKKYDWQELIVDQKNLRTMKVYIKRYQIIKKHLMNFDYIVYIDSDIVINNPYITIESIINDVHDIFMYQDIGLYATTLHLLHSAYTIDRYLSLNNIQYLKQPEDELQRLQIFGTPIKKTLRTITANPLGINSGFLILKSSNIVKSLLDDLMLYYPMFESTCFDQDCLAKIISLKKYKDVFKLLPIQGQGNPLFGHPDFTYNEQKNFICHYYGNKSNKELLKQHINNIKNNKWWSKLHEDFCNIQ